MRKRELQHFLTDTHIKLSKEGDLNTWIYPDRISWTESVNQITKPIFNEEEEERKKENAKNWRT